METLQARLQREAREKVYNLVKEVHIQKPFEDVTGEPHYVTNEIMKIISHTISETIKAERADWLRSEIETLEWMKANIPPYPHEGAHGHAITLGAQRGYQDALTSTITRYKEELLELENHP